MLRKFSRGQSGAGVHEDVDAETSAAALDPERALQRFQLVRSVHEAIAALERPSREVLILRDLEGMSGEETCAALGIPLATMKTRLHRARAQLRVALERAGA